VNRELVRTDFASPVSTINPTFIRSFSRTKWLWTAPRANSELHTQTHQYVQAYPHGESSRNGLVGNHYAYNANLWGNDKWGINTSPQDHNVHYFSIAFTKWRYQIPHRDTQQQQWLPTTRACERSVSGRFATHRSSLLLWHPLSAPLTLRSNHML